MPSLTDAIVAELRAEMRAAHVTYDALAQTSGVRRRTLVRHLTGDTPITLAVAEQVADALGVTMDEVFARAKMRRDRPAPEFVTDDGEEVLPIDTPPASPSPEAPRAPRQTARPAAVGPADS